MTSTKTKIFASDLHRLGGGYSVQFTAGLVDGTLLTNCVWHPTMPTPRERRRKVDMTRYAYALAQFTEAVLAALVIGEGDTP